MDAKRKAPKLSIKRETLKNLTEGELARVGGAGARAVFTVCSRALTNCESMISDPDQGMCPSPVPLTE